MRGSRLGTVTIHSGHPFPTPDDLGRRFRGRLGGAVTLWTSGDDRERAGLTVSSLMVAGGEPVRVLALVDPDSDLAELVEETGTAVVQLLRWRHRDLAEAFAGTAPAPGGPFRGAEWAESAWGPRLADGLGWAGVRLESASEVGWSRLLTCTVEEVALQPDEEPLMHRRGRYSRG